ncbi:hypothetical protein B484DRAFT_418158, partial [Ochromonadaceae sp. CCMP2298]
MRQEVQGAWGSYQALQDRAAAEAALLREEIRGLQVQQAAERAQAAERLSRAHQELADSRLLVVQVAGQRQEVQASLTLLSDEAALWEGRVDGLQRELSEAKQGAAGGAQLMRGELHAAQVSAEQMNLDNSAFIRQSQSRQEQLEREALELSAVVAQQAKELQGLREGSSHGGGYGASPGGAGGAGVGGTGGVRGVGGTYCGQCQSLQREVLEIHAQSEASHAEVQRLRADLAVAAASQGLAEGAAQEEAQLLHTRIAALEALLPKPPPQSPSREPHPQSPSGWQEMTSPLGPGQGQGPGLEGVLRELQEHRAQSQSLSKLLLKKQGAVLELQAERAALRSRLVDMQARCVRAEASKDLEGGEDAYAYSSGTSAG